MRLKYQLLLLGLISFLLPLTGWFALKSVDKEFRYSMQQTSKNTLGSLQASVQQFLLSNENFLLKGIVTSSIKEITLDGDASEWQQIPAYNYSTQQNTLSVKLAYIQNSLSLFIQSNDTTQSHNPLNDNDYIIIGMANDRGMYKYKIARQAEGTINATHDATQKPPYQAYWHELANGYTLEINFDLRNVHHIGFASINKNQKKEIITGSLQNNNSLKLLPIVGDDKQLQQAIERITPLNNHFMIKDKQGRIIHQSNKLPSKQKPSAWQWIMTPIYQWVFAIEESASWYYRQSDGMAGITQKLEGNELSYHLNSMMPQGQQSMIQSLLKAGVLMIAVVFIIILAYLLYSLLLALRIKKLNNTLQTVLDDSGKLHIQMPSRLAKDEIGDLSRGIESMLGEMNDYTQYLKDIGSRLSHEMKTPLAIVQSSLDNLELEQSAQFLQRAQEGTKRLRFILNQLSELSRLKYALESTEKEVFNLATLCQNLGQSYQSIIPQLKLNITQEEITILGSSDLIAQLVDKLIDNAKDFTPQTGEINLNLVKHSSYAVLSVINSGSQIPEKLGNRVFDSLVSSRRKNIENNNPHLGLGLYIVQLIAKYHKAKITMLNHKSVNKVEFSIKIKLIK